MNPIVIFPYNPHWPQLFDEEAERIKEVLGKNCVAIHHIGSTSVPGLCAKPVIDMIPVVRNILKVDAATSAMEALGYESKGENGIVFRRYFSRPGFHLHVFEEGSAEIERHLLFRDYMRMHPDVRTAYAALKKGLAQKHPNDIMAYCLGKDAFVRYIDQESGYSGFQIVRVLTPREWAAYHRIRREQIIEPAGLVYDFQHWTLSHPHHHHFVFLKDTEIIGVVQVEFLDEARAILRPIAIDTPYQNQGYGTLLLKQIQRWIQHQGRTMIHLHATMRAVPFYTRAGYTTMPFEDPDCVRGQDCMDMGIVLPPITRERKPFPRAV